MMHIETEDLPVDYCAACRQAIYRDQEAVWYDGDWYCDTACLVEALGAEWGPVDEILEKMAAQ